MTRARTDLLAGFTWLLVAFMLLPLVLIVWMSFTPREFFILPLGEFSLRWYQQIFAHPGFVQAFFLSLGLAALAALVATALGFVAAYALVRHRFPGAGALDAFLMSPLIIPSIVFGIAMLQYLNRLGLYNRFAGLLAAHAVVTLPYTMRTLSAAIRAVPYDLELAAMNLGAGWARTFRRVTLPLTNRGLVASLVFGFIISFDEVTVTLFIAGPTYQTLPVRMYNYLSDQVDPTVAAISTLLMLLSLVVILVLERVVGLRNLFR